MKSNLKIVPTIALLALLSITLFELYNSHKQEGPTEVNMGTFSIAIDYAPFIIAKHEGWFDASLAPFGAKAHFEKFETLPAINKSLERGRLDFIFEAEPPAIIGRAAGIDVRIIGESCSLTQEIVVPLKSTIQNVGDLRGRRIAVLSGTSSHYGLIKTARDAGLKDKELSIIDMRPPVAKNAFETGQVDGWAVWPPWVEQEIVTGRGRVIRGGDAKIQSILAVRGKFADDHLDITNAI